MKLTKLMTTFSAALAIATPLLSLQTAAIAQSRRTFSVYNNADKPIQSLYLSRSSRDSWGYNDLDSTLFSGNSIGFTMPDNECDYDLKVVFSDGQTHSQMNIDTCLNNSYSVRLQPQPLRVMPVASAGSYQVYEKPTNVSDAQMQSAGARFYPGGQACSLHYSLCVSYSGVWLSQQSSLVIQPLQTSLENTQSQNTQSQNTQAQNSQAQNSQDQPQTSVPASTESVSDIPRSDTELYLAYYRDCMNRTMFRTLRTSNRAIAHNGYDMGYRFGRKPGDLSDEQMETAGLRWEWGFQSWIGPQSEAQIPLMESAEAAQICQEEVNDIRD